MPVAPGQPLESQLLEASSTAESGGERCVRIEREHKWLDPGRSNRLILWRMQTGGGLPSALSRVSEAQGKDCNRG